MAFLELCLYVIECFRKYILLLISVQNALQKCKFQLAANSAHVQRIPATRLISQHSESDFVKLMNDRFQARALKTVMAAMGANQWQERLAAETSNANRLARNTIRVIPGVTAE